MATKTESPKKIELLSDPVVRAVLEQQIPGVYATSDDESPGVKKIAKNAQEATDELGLLFYGSKDKKIKVLFNPVVVSADEVKAADEQGQLTQIFPEYNQLLGGGAPEAGAEAEAPTPQTSLGSPPRRAAAPADKLKAMTPPSPPGASNLIGALQAPTI